MSKSPILIASLATLIAGGAFAQQPPAPVVQVAHVAETEVAPTVAVPGTIYSRNDVQVTAGVAGQLIMVAEPGTLVSAGDPVARIDRTPLLLQRAEQEVLLERAEIVTDVVAEGGPESLDEVTGEEAGLRVTGVVRERPEGTVNEHIPTGEVEIGDCQVEVHR